MRAKFVAQSAKPLEGQNCFLILGQVIEGQVAAGMLVEVMLNLSLTMTGKVSKVQTMDSPEGTLGLVIPCETAEELQVWTTLKIGEGEVLSLHDEDDDVWTEA